MVFGLCNVLTIFVINCVHFAIRVFSANLLNLIVYVHRKKDIVYTLYIKSFEKRKRESDPCL